jgi:hypothetical protein
MAATSSPTWRVGQWSALDREKHIAAMAEADADVHKNYEIIVAQEPAPAARRRRGDHPQLGEIPGVRR